MKNRSFFLGEKNKGEDKPEERNKKRKGEGRREVCKKRTKGGCSKRKRQNIFFSKINAIGKNENTICPRRDDTFFQQQGFQLKMKIEKHFLVFFLRKGKNVSIFFLFTFWREKIKKKKWRRNENR